jgi:hypothetical protein
LSCATTTVRRSRINRPTISLVHGLVSSVPHTQIEQSAASWHRPIFTRCQGAFHLPSTKARFDPQMSPHMRVFSIGELKSPKHIGWNEEYIAQLVGAGLFRARVHRGAWRESHIDDWLRARKAKGDLSWMRFSLKEMIG